MGTWEAWPACPCGCGVDALKLTKYGHVIGCACRSCIGRRSQRAGKRAQAKGHRALGGQGFTPSNEESARPYQIEVTVMPEHKTGQQVPATFDRFITTDWFRRALDQSTRAVPTGSGALPCVVIRGQWAVIDIRGGRKGERLDG